MWRIIYDIFTNFIGSLFPIVVLYFFIYPVLTQKLDAEEYGIIITTISILYIIAGTLGNALSATRLICDYNYKLKKITGDYNIIFISVIIINIVIIPIVLSIILKVKILFRDIFLLTILSLLVFSYSYMEVSLRLKLDYKKIFISKLISSLGYLAGYVFFIITYRWEYIFIFSLFFPILYFQIKTKILYEQYKVTELFNITINIYKNLTISTFLDQLFKYSDKLLIYKLLGGPAVSIYFASTFLGRFVIYVISSITNVILSYLSKNNYIQKKQFFLFLILDFLFCIIMYIICIIISKPILQIFYPNLFTESCKLISIASAALCLSAFVDIMYPFTLKAFDSSKQIFIQISGLIVYIIVVFLGYLQYGLWWCCFSLLIANFVRFLLIIFFVLHRNGYEYQYEKLSASNI